MCIPSSLHFYTPCKHCGTLSPYSINYYSKSCPVRSDDLDICLRKIDCLGLYTGSCRIDIEFFQGLHSAHTPRGILKLTKITYSDTYLHQYSSLVGSRSCGRTKLGVLQQRRNYCRISTRAGKVLCTPHINNCRIRIFY